MKRNLALLLFVVSIGLLSSCKNKSLNEDLGPIVYNDGQTITCITETPDLRSLFDTETRLSLTPKTGVDGSKQGLSIIWEYNEKVPVYTYFKQGNIQRAAKMVIMTVKHDDNTEKYIGTFEIKVPAGINLQSGEKVYITGAIGVDSIDENGIVTIDRSGSLETGYIPPMYFEFQEVEKESTRSGTAYVIKPAFKLYGSILNLEITNDKYPRTGITQIVFDTAGLFQVEGKMDLRTATTTSAPTWQPLPKMIFGTYNQNWQIINMNWTNFDNNETKIRPIWIKPNPDKQIFGRSHQIAIYFRNQESDQSPKQTGEIGNTYNITKDIKDNKVYDLKANITLRGSRI